MRMFPAKLICIMGIAAASVSLSAASVSRQYAESFERKVATLSAPRRAGSPQRRTAVTEDEINSWFTYRAHPNLPTGVSSPQVTLVGGGRVAGQAVVDLEVVGRRRATGGVFDPWSLLGGRVPVGVTGVVRARDGIGRFTIESATIGGVPVPTVMIQELLSWYSRSPERPEGVRLDDAFALPADIRQIEVVPGQAVVVQ